MLSRNKEQELSMQIIYNYLFDMSINMDKDPRKLIEEHLDVPYEEASLFVKEVVIKALIHLDETIKLISENLTNWKLERMNKVTIAILVLGITEAKYVTIDGIFKAAIIDVCVNLAKRFCADNDYRFVNAVLDKVI